MRKHASRLLVLSIPTIIEEILSTLLQYVDTAMVGRLGEEATAAVSTTTTVTWLVNSVPGAIGTAMLILISRASPAHPGREIRNKWKNCRSRHCCCLCCPALCWAAFLSC